MALRFPGCDAELLVDGITHQLTHQLLHAQCYAIRSSSYAETVSDGLWVPLQNLQDYAMPQLLVRIIRKISR